MFINMVSENIVYCASITGYICIILRKRSVQLIARLYCRNYFFMKLEELHMNGLNLILAIEIK